MALEKSLEMILSEGMDARFERHRKLASIFRNAMKELGMKFIPTWEDNCANTLSAPYFPEEFNGGDFLKKVGENGVRLSGGQRQRISIARALYRNAKVLILDEPTNALDIKTEEQLINTLIKISKDITIIMISHNSSSMKYFDRVIDLENI